MKKLFLIVAFAVFVPAIFAQTPGPPPPGDDYYPERWKTFEFKDDKFKVRLPGKPTETPGGPDSTGAILRTNEVKYVGVVRFRLTVLQLSSNQEKAGNGQGALDSLRNGGINGVSQYGPKIIKEEAFSLNGHPGKFLQFEINTGRVFRAKMLVVGDRIYNIMVTSGKAEQLVMGSENDYEKIAMALLDSFELMP